MFQYLRVAMADKMLKILLTRAEDGKEPNERKS